MRLQSSNIQDHTMTQTFTTEMNNSLTLKRQGIRSMELIKGKNK